MHEGLRVPDTTDLLARNIDPPQGGSLTATDPNSTEVPAPFKEAKDIMDRERGTAENAKANGAAPGKAGGHKKKISISQKTPGLWTAEEEDE